MEWSKDLCLKKHQCDHSGHTNCKMSIPFFGTSESCNNLVISFSFQAGEQKTEYRAWNPFRSKLAAAILGGVDKIHMGPGKKVLYLGAASGTTVSHVSDIVGPVSS